MSSDHIILYVLWFNVMKLTCNIIKHILVPQLVFFCVSAEESCAFGEDCNVCPRLTSLCPRINFVGLESSSMCPGSTSVCLEINSACPGNSSVCPREFLCVQGAVLGVQGEVLCVHGAFLYAWGTVLCVQGTL